MSRAFAESALTAIEFPAALDLVAQHAVTPLGAARVRCLVPRADAWWVAEELARVAEFAVRLKAGDALAPDPFPDVAGGLGRLRFDGSVLEGSELVGVEDLLVAARTSFTRVRRAAKDAGRVGALAAPPVPREIEQHLAAALEPDGTVRDAASKALARIRRDIRDVRRRLVARLEAIVLALDERHRPAEATVTLRGGRYVIPVRREGRGWITGIVHDESATHATLFVEPAETVELGNRLRELEAEEAREVLRVLRELTERIRPHADALAATFEAMIELDSCWARARFAVVHDCCPPRIAGHGVALAIRRGVHPLLAASPARAVAFDLVLDPADRTVIVSGPNAGGKTVLVKAVGLLVALAQSGVLPPVGPQTSVPVFTGLFADIGDRQSIQENLSTFSAHVAALRDVLERADELSLVLLDEIGTGTDPAEGSALASAVLHALTARRAITIATTHLGSLKQLADREPGVVNASLEFDAAALTPTFRFTKGIPGRSYGLAIARRLGLDADVLAEAEAAVPVADRTLDAALARLEERRRDLERREAELAARAAELDAALAGQRSAAGALAEREAAARAREKEVERAARHATRAYLKEARAEVERAIEMVREERYREARRAVEEAMGRAAADEVAVSESVRAEPDPDAPSAERLAALARRPGSHAGPAPRADLAPGTYVRIASLGLQGELQSLDEDRATVVVRGRRIRVRVEDVVAVATSTP